MDFKYKIIFIKLYEKKIQIKYKISETNSFYANYAPISIFEGRHIIFYPYFNRKFDKNQNVFI